MGRRDEGGGRLKEPHTHALWARTNLDPSSVPFFLASGKEVLPTLFLDVSPSSSERTMLRLKYERSNPDDDDALRRATAKNRCLFFPPFASVIIGNSRVIECCHRRFNNTLVFIHIVNNSLFSFPLSIPGSEAGAERDAGAGEPQRKPGKKWRKKKKKMSEEEEAPLCSSALFQRRGVF